ncbi:MAG: isopentenyl phosphate kinase, partial [Rhizonema sp. PD37]|nr:isopentenyl phosphate kinase [Rhizonema sp. PD37]
TARPEIIAQLVEEVTIIRQENPNLKLILGNGAGSFAHQSAKKYNTIDGFLSDEEKIGFCFVHQDALDLNRILTKVFLQANLPVISLPPLTMVVTHNKKLFTSDFCTVENSLQAGLIPLVFGDVVLDKAIGGTVLSTDTLLALLAKYFHLQQKFQVRVVNAGNYPGVCDKDGQVLSHITPANYSQIKVALGKSESVDVTGGMAQKVEEFLAISSLGIDCWIIDGNIPGNLAKAVLGAPTQGTLIRAV